MSARVLSCRVGSLPTACADGARSLHKAVFGDGDEDIDRLFAAGADGTYLYIEAEGQIAAGCFLFGATLFSRGEEYRGSYLFALCTEKAYRGRGYARALLAAAKDAAQDFLLLCPADEGLADFYRREGFTRALDGCTPVGGEPESSAPRGFSPCGCDDALCAARAHGGLLLERPLFELSLSECGALPLADGDRFAAVSAGKLYAGIGVTPARPVRNKALAYLKKEIDTNGIFADLLLEV